MDKKKYRINGKDARVYNICNTDTITDFILKEKDLFKDNGIELKDNLSNTEMLNIFKGINRAFFDTFSEDLTTAKLSLKLNEINIWVSVLLFGENKDYTKNITYKKSSCVPIEFIGTINRYNSDIYSITIF